MHGVVAMAHDHVFCTNFVMLVFYFYFIFYFNISFFLKK